MSSERASPSRSAINTEANEDQNSLVAFQEPRSELSFDEDAAPITEPANSLRTPTENHIIDEGELETPRSGSKGQIADEDMNVSSGSRPRSASSRRSRESTRMMQEQMRVDYLQAQDFPVESCSNSTSESGSINMPLRVERARQRLREIEQQADTNTSSIPNCQVLAAEDVEGTVAASVPAPAVYKLRKSFKMKRNLEAANWFPSPRDSKTLPRNFRHGEDVQASSLSSSADGSRTFRSTSLLGKHPRHVLGYAQPTDQEDLDASDGIRLSGNLEAGVTQDMVGSESPQERSRGAPLNPALEEGNALPGPCTSSLTLLSARRTWDHRKPQHLTIEPTISRGLSSQEERTTSAQRNSRRCEVLEEADGSTRPMSEPAASEPKSQAAEPIVATEKRPRWVDCFLVVWRGGN
ncbi:hypothetical protein EJ07DRAFT_157148 [Lizonia empirigonia]|nr:hypothetical protein EJ07DRAFT_157148 [Lizonia empirigonia]